MSDNIVSGSEGLEGGVVFGERWAAVGLAVLFGFAFVLISQTTVRGQEPPPAAEPTEVEGGEEFAAGRLILLYEPGASEAARKRVVGSIPGSAGRSLAELDAAVVEVPAAKRARPGEDRKQALRRARADLEQKPGVEAVEYDYVSRASYVPNDARYSRQYGLRRSSFVAAWGESRGNDGRGVRIGVVDAGIDDDHPDLRGKILAQKDFAYDDNRAEDDRAGHGSHVAGIAAAATGNRRGVAGACPDCRLLVAKALRYDGVGFNSDIADGIRWSAQNGAEVINLSLGSTAYSDVLRRAIDYAHNDRGAVVVAAAGNRADQGSPTEYPASLSNVIAVASTDRENKRAADSSRGAWVDVAAPGVKVHSTLPGGYGDRSGTSMAAPHVAALAGLLAGRGYSNSAIRSRILSSATDLGPRGRDPSYGAGLIDAAAAVR